MDNFISEIFEDPFFSKSAEFTLFSEIRNEFGEPVKNGRKETLICIIQPAGKDDLETLPEGNRFNPTIRVMTQEPVNAGDELIYKDVRWKIINDGNWSDYGYYDTLATRYEGSQTDNSDGFRIT